MKAITRCALAAVLVAVAGTHAAEQDEPSKLDVLKSKYEEAQSSISSEFDKQKSAASATYGKTLDAYLIDLKKRGQLDDYLALEKEKARFDTEQTVPAADARTNAYVMKTAEQYDETVSKAKVEQQKRTAFLMSQYLSRLDTLIKELMVADRIADAKLAKDELDRCQFVLALVESEIPEVEPQVEPNVEPKLDKNEPKVGNRSQRIGKLR